MAELTIKLSQVNYLSLLIATTNCLKLVKKQQIPLCIWELYCF